MAFFCPKKCSTGLSLARKKAHEARQLIANNTDPSDERKQAKAEIKQVKETKRLSDAGLPLPDSFESVAREWHKRQSQKWNPRHADRVLQRLINDIFPWIGLKTINAIDASELLAAVKRIEDRGAVESAHRAKWLCGQIFRYGVVTGKCDRNPEVDLKGALMQVKEAHHASITKPKLIGELLRAIEGYQGHFVTKCALKLAPLLFVRPGELCHAEWSELELNDQQWRIPAHKMKMAAVHIVPLSDQALAIFEEAFRPSQS